MKKKQVIWDGNFMTMARSLSLCIVLEDTDEYGEKLIAYDFEQGIDSNWQKNGGKIFGIAHTLW